MVIVYTISSVISNVWAATVLSRTEISVGRYSMDVLGIGNQ